jgi:hypothetical protein
MRLEHVRSEIARLRAQASRQRSEIRQLVRAGLPTAAAEALLERMLDAVDLLCGERDRLRKTQAPAEGSSIRTQISGGRSQ